jgi:peptidoglycan/LPS O-acetylase OafA/YrhL
MQRSKGIDILRAVAVFLVLGRHIELVPGNSSSGVDSFAHWLSQLWIRGGWVGVDLFFVLSGFLVSGLLFREHRKFGAISARDFLIRRGFKIYPAFWMLIGVTVLVRVLHHAFHPKATLSELLFLQNYGPSLWPHTWSLAVEEHFYILLLLFLLFLSRRNLENPFSSIPRAFFLLAVLSLCVRIFESFVVPFSLKTNLFPSHLRMDSLYCGVVISYFYYYHSARFLDIAKRFRVPALALGVGALAPAFLFPLETTPLIYTLGLTLFYIGSGLILIGVLTFKIPENGFVTSAAYIGSHSYSIYLWHMPLAIWGLPLLYRILGPHLNWCLYCASYFLGAAFLGIVMASAIEFPLLKVRDRWFPSRARPLEVASKRNTGQPTFSLPAQTADAPQSSPS